MCYDNRLAHRRFELASGSRRALLPLAASLCQSLPLLSSHRSALCQVSPTPTVHSCLMLLAILCAWELQKRNSANLTGGDQEAKGALISASGQAVLERRHRSKGNGNNYYCYVLSSCTPVPGHSIERRIPFSNSNLQAHVLASPCESSATNCPTSSSNGRWSLLLHVFNRWRL